MAETTIRTLEQERAQQAWLDVESVVKGKNFEAEYKGLVKNAPVLILTNGLTQTLSFFEAKKKPHHLALNRHISAWVCKKLKLTRPEQRPDLLKKLLDGDSNLLRLATQESLAYLQWLKRFADAQIEKEASEEKV